MIAEIIRILLVDDHPVVRDGLAAVLSTQADFVVVGQAGSGREALAQAQQLVASPGLDLVLMDLEMPEMDGVEATRALLATHPALAVVVFTAFDTDERILGALEAGAQGYLLKGAPREEVFRAVRVARQGGALLPPAVAAKLLTRVREDPDALTPREREVLQQVAEGASNRAIATALHISERTVKFHVSALLAKLGAANRTEAVAIANRRGLLPR